MPEQYAWIVIFCDAFISLSLMPAYVPANAGTLPFDLYYILSFFFQLSYIAAVRSCLLHMCKTLIEYTIKNFNRNRFEILSYVETNIDRFT